MYLTYLALTQGLEDLALLTLNSLEFKAPWTQQQWQLFALIASTPNHTPEATAVKMQAAIATMKNEKQARFGEAPILLNGHDQTQFWCAIAKELPRYLNLQGKEYSRIPPHYLVPEEVLSSITRAIQSFKRNDGGKLNSSPSDIFMRSTHFRFHPDYTEEHANPQFRNSLDYWIETEENWEKDLKIARESDYYEKRTLIPSGLWRDRPDRMGWDYSVFNSWYMQEVGNARQNAPHTAPSIVQYSLESIRNNHAHILAQVQQLANSWGSSKGSVQPVDLEIYLMYKSLKDEALENVEHAGRHASNWRRGIPLVHDLWVHRANAPEFTLKKAGPISCSPFHRPLVEPFAKTPPPAPITHQLVPRKEEAFTPWTPLETVLTRYFDVDPVPCYAEKDKTFVIDPAQMPSDVKETAQAIKASFETAKSEHELAPRDRTFNSYKLKDNKTANDLKNGLTNLRDTIDLQSLTERIVQAANYPSTEERKTLPYDQQLAAALRDQQVASGQVNALTFLDILLTFDPQQPQSLKALNPCLTEEKLTALHTLCVEYFMLNMKMAQLSAGLEELQSATPEGVLSCAEILAKKQTFSLSDHWILALYQSMSGQMLRSEPDQAGLLLAIVHELFKEGTTRDPEKLRQLFFEFQAGGGKTKIIAVILAVYAKRFGKTPVFISLPQLFDISKQDLNDSLGRFLRKRAHPIDLKLDHLPTLQELHNLRDVLQYPSEKDLCFIITPETYHSLWLEYQRALIWEEGERVKVLDQIFCFFEEQAIDLVDEAHRNASPTLESNVAFGQGIPLPLYVTTLYSDVFRFLLSDPVWSAKVALLKREQGRLSLQDKKLLQNKLAMHFAANILTVKEEAVSQPLIHFLTDLDAPTPPEANDSRRLAALRGLICKILPYAFELVEDIDHGPSVDKKNEVEAPLNRKEKTLAKFENAELSLALTIKGFLQRGLTDTTQIRNLVALMIEEKTREAPNVAPGELTETEKLFLSWQKEDKIKFALTDLILSPSNELWQLLLDRLAKNSDAIFKYLELKPLKEIFLYPFKITSTASRLAYGFYANLFFSATLGPAEKYPFFADLKNYRRDLEFIAKVIQRGSVAPNEEFMWYTEKDIPTFLAQLPQEKLHSGRMEGFINFGGTCPGKTSFDWAKEAIAYFKDKRLPYDGAVYVHRETPAGEKVLYLLTKDNPTPTRLNGSDLNKQLELLDKKDLKIFKIYDADDTTGLDLAIKPDGLMAVTLGEDPATDDTAQALLRMRQFIKSMQSPEKGQGVIWCIPEAMKPKLAHLLGKSEGAPISPKELFIWSLMNYSKKIQAEILSGAYQELEGIFVELARRDMRGKDQAKQIELFKEKYLAGFIKIHEYDPLKLYGHANQLESTRKVLEEFVANCSKSFNTVLEDNSWAKKRSEQIIKRTEAVIPKTTSHIQPGLNTQAHQRQRTQQRQRNFIHEVRNQRTIRVQKSGAAERKEGDYPDKELALVEKSILEKEAFIRPAFKVFESPVMPKNIYLTVDAIFAGDVSHDKKWTLNHLKPADHMLIVKDGDAPPVYIAVSQENIKSYHAQITENKVMPGRKVALIGQNGTCVINQGFDSSYLLSLKTTPEFEEIAAWMAWMNGKAGLANATSKKVAETHLEEAKRIFQLAQQGQIRPSQREWMRFQALIDTKKEVAEWGTQAAPSLSELRWAGHRTEKEAAIKAPSKDLLQKGHSYAKTERLSSAAPLPRVLPRATKKAADPAPKLPQELKGRNINKWTGIGAIVGTITTVALACLTFIPNMVGLHGTLLGTYLVLGSGAFTVALLVGGLVFYVYSHTPR